MRNLSKTEISIIQNKNGVDISRILHKIKLQHELYTYNNFIIQVDKKKKYIGNRKDEKYKIDLFLCIYT